MFMVTNFGFPFLTKPRPYTMKTKLLLILILSCGVSVKTSAQLNVSFSINATTGRAPISPLIYGTNQILSSTDRYKSLRMGGNRITGLNWENNASNAGSDYFHQSDSYLCGNLSAADCNIPGKVYTEFYKSAQVNAIPNALTTLQMAGYVAADKNGIVTEAETAPSARWKQVVFKKNSAFALSPNTTDNYVYMDELVNYLKTNLGTASAGGMKGYFLDNEPALWPSTHPRIHPSKPTAVELWTKSRDLSIAIKDVDVSAEIFGGVFYGFGAYLNLQDAPDWSSQKGSFAWYIDYFLAKMKGASDVNGRRLLDVLDLHWYPEAIGDNRITNSDANTANDKAARIQAPRTLWDADYKENSWIATYFSNFLPLIPVVQNSISAYYPNTKLSFSEYCYGGCNDYSGGIAQADVLGIFGKYGVYNANFWDVCGGPSSYVSAGFKIFTNYNGSGGSFGDTKVTASMSDKANASIYASINGVNENNLHVVVINKSGQSINGSFNINSGVAYTVGSVWGFDQNNAAITSRAGISSITGNTFNYVLPPYSVYHIVLSAAVSGTTTVVVRAKSINTGSNMRIEIMDQASATAGTVIQSASFNNVPTTFTSYSYNFTGNIPANRIRVRFLNNGGTPSRDLEVDYIQVAGVTYQSEDPKTYSFGSSSGCAKGGYFQTQVLTCNGYFHYDIGTVVNAPIAIYTDALASDWADWSWSATNNFAVTSPVKVGTNSLGSTFTAGWGGVSFRKATAINTGGYNAIQFWVHGGTGNNKSLLFNSQTEDGAGTSPSVAFTATAGAWNQIAIPFSSLGNPSTIKRINFQNNSASAQSVIYFDDIKLISTGSAKEASEFVEQSRMMLSPNPLRGNVLHITREAVPPGEIIEICFSDMVGREFFKTQLKNDESDVVISAPLPNGLYLVNIKTGNKLVVQKLMVEN
jgi:hypothetical protein